MKVEEYGGHMTGRVFDGRAVTVVSGRVGDPIDPVSKSDNLTFTEFDKTRVEELRAWWKTYNENRPDEVVLPTEVVVIVVVAVVVLGVVAVVVVLLEYLRSSHR
jgi:hypothetical protein